MYIRIIIIAPINENNKTNTLYETFSLFGYLKSKIVQADDELLSYER